MRNIKLTIEYDGTNYMGWQFQKHGRTIQGTIMEALERILHHNVNLKGASRTDAGVHAFGQVATFKTNKKIPLYKLQRALNGLLPHDIKVISTEEVTPSFDPRREAKGKTYIYRIFNRKIASPFEYKRAWFIPESLDIEIFKKSLTYFKGTHDFTTFSKLSKDENRNPVRTIDSITLHKNNHIIKIEITGRSFLRHMIRIIVATAVECAKGKLKPENIPEMFKAKDRRKAPFLAPAEGLYLMKIYYKNYPYSNGELPMNSDDKINEVKIEKEPYES
ncbi:tRNA pseudouridine(38-40) synthase TruA [Desulfurobacterium indicum]|uniref:tRNA pseudouridine synthase A n=1 Tax=Desulfurobacterium indicum TaxID=1914305 RepID=A0A1R1ML87_9BACT|nr:tRNA pseudouridine(38-40) synthase TruA [Desulfurobacterium indicum]OMH40526.1 tRNA pseudouridine(38-40) synthase TruA [Desulfurobacterium indicum]